MLNINIALPKDNSTLVDLVQDIQLMHADVYPHVFKSNPDVVELSEYFADVLASDSCSIYIASVDDLSVGYVWVEVQARADTALISEGVRLQVQHLYVRANHRLSGVGTMLMDCVFQLATDRGINEISLSVLAFNVGAQKFYKNIGFETYELKMWKMT